MTGCINFTIYGPKHEKLAMIACHSGKIYKDNSLVDTFHYLKQYNMIDISFDEEGITMSIDRRDFYER